MQQSSVNSAGVASPKSRRAATSVEFAKYMADHGIHVVLNRLVSRLADLQPHDPWEQMRLDLENL
eukprot:1334635-Rhodomonas_salina.1